MRDLENTWEEKAVRFSADKDMTSNVEILLPDYSPLGPCPFSQQVKYKLLETLTEI